MKHVFLLMTIIALAAGAFAGGLLWRQFRLTPDQSLRSYGQRFAAFALTILTTACAMYAWSFSQSQLLVDFFVVLFLGSLLVFSWYSLNWVVISASLSDGLNRKILPTRIGIWVLTPSLLLIFLQQNWLSISVIIVLLSLFFWVQTLLAIAFRTHTDSVPWWLHRKFWLALTGLTIAIEFWLTQDGYPLKPYLSIAMPLLFFMESLRVIYQVLQEEVDRSPAPPAQPSQSYGLSDREHEVSQLVLQGMSNKQIAYELAVSEHTVRNHLSKVFQKVGVRKRTELFAKLQPSQHADVQSN